LGRQAVLVARDRNSIEPVVGVPAVLHGHSHGGRRLSSGCDERAPARRARQVRPEDLERIRRANRGAKAVFKQMFTVHARLIVHNAERYTLCDCHALRLP
jgi:hypothetical protein